MPVSKSCLASKLSCALLSLADVSGDNTLLLESLWQ